MAVGDIKVIKGAGPVVRYLAEDRGTSSVTSAMLPGEPVKVGGTGTNFVLPLVTGDPEVGTDEMVGIVYSESTETAAADGEVYVTTMFPVKTILQAKATTSSNVDTQAKIDVLMGDWIALDVTGAGTNGPTGVFSFDENETTDPNVHGFKVVAGEPVRGTLNCMVHSMATQAGTTV